MIIGIPPKAKKSYRKRVAAFAHEMVAMIDNIKLKERQDVRSNTVHRDNNLDSMAFMANGSD